MLDSVPVASAWTLRQCTFLVIAVGCAPVTKNLDRPANRGILKKTLGRFQLTGNSQPVLKEINGGRLCVNAFGKTSAGWYFTANVSLEDCAGIASEQPRVLGFRWGRSAFDYGFFTKHARPLSSDTSFVDLSQLFPGDAPFTCTIYVSDDFRGQPVPFHTSNRTAMLGIEQASLQDGPAQELCFQRWTMTQFFKPRVTELWFCYMPTNSVQGCEKKAHVFYLQGEIFVGVFLVLLGGLGFIINGMQQFEAPLVEFSGLLLNLELGLMCVGYLLERWQDTESFTFFLAAYVMNIVASVLVFIPYHVMEHFDEDNPFNTAYLLLVAFSPCFLLEFASYWSHFILLVGHWPLLVGFIAYSTKMFASRLFYYALEYHYPTMEKEPGEKPFDDDERKSYQRVPTVELECGDLVQCREQTTCGIMKGTWGQLSRCGRRA